MPPLPQDAEPDAAPRRGARRRCAAVARAERQWLLHALSVCEVGREKLSEASAADPIQQVPYRPGLIRGTKSLLLGRPLGTAQLAHERLGKPTALAVFASDALSSTAYATEEILRQLVPVVGLLAFSYTVPIAGAVVVVLAILLFSYRQTIKEYPSAGGAYIVTKDNFGLLAAQFAGVSLLTDYILTVAVSVSAGVSALISAFPGLYSYKVIIAVGFVALIALGNLRGVRESGKLFAAPTYVFIATMFFLVIVGIVRAALGGLEPMGVAPIPGGHGGEATEFVHVVGLFLILHAFSSGCTAATGVEAISNGVPAFKPPEWKNARSTLGTLVVVLGLLFLGISFLAAKLQVIPDPEEKVTVVAMIAKEVFGGSMFGNGFFVFIQFATMLILVLAANTSFADFPRLASFAADDSFLPRQFTKRGHRLVYSNGIIFLSLAAIVLIIGFNASVTRLIPLYAIGVFTSFTLSQAGMARHHIHKRQQGWKVGLAINLTGAIVTALVTVIVAITKFADGAWAIIVAIPIFVFLLFRLNRQYRREAVELRSDVKALMPERAERHVVVVSVEEIDQKLLTALEFAKTVIPDELHCVHVAADSETASTLEVEWAESGPDIPLEIVECGDGDVPTAMTGFVAGLTGDNVATTVVTPGPFKMNWWVRLKKGRTGYRLSRALSQFPNTNVVVVRDHPGRFQQSSFSPGSTRIRIHPRPGHEAIVLVDRIDITVLRAVRYAQATQPLSIRCLHVAIDPLRAAELLDQWQNLKIDVPFEVIRCEDRDIGRALSRYVSKMAHPRIALSMVLPRRDYARAWHRLLHDRTSRQIARELYEHKNVYVIAVPYHFSKSVDAGTPTDPNVAVPEPTQPATTAA